MGAGTPAGWHVVGENYHWEPEAKPGPLGVGAARIRFRPHGRLSLDGPARFMRAGVSHAACVWLRSKPPGATVQLMLRDNDSHKSIAFSKELTATEDWRFEVVHGVLPKAAKDRYYLSLTAAGNDGTLWLDGLWLGERETPIDSSWRPSVRPAGVVLKPVAGWGIVTGDEPLRAAATAVGVTRPGCRLRLRAVHTNGMAADLPSVALDDSGVWHGGVEVTGAIARPFGMIRLEATVADSNGRPLSPLTETLLARAPEPVPGPVPKSPFGVHVALREPDVAAVAKLGYKWCRIHDANGSTKWGYAEPKPGKWVWFDDEIDLARRHGLCILGLLDGSPPWESGTKRTGYFSIYGAPKHIDHWRRYVRQVVGHYAGRIDEWEVWNEPWDMGRFFQGGSPQLYVKLLRAAHHEAKRANPKATIVGIDTYPAVWDRAVLMLGAYPYYDVLSWHRYDPGLYGRPDDGIARVSDRLQAEQAKYGKPKPLLCSEGGPDVSLFHGSFFSFADPVLVGDWSRGADQYPRMFLSSIAAGNQRFIAYSVHNAHRYGWATHMMVEAGYLLRPMHLSLAALAYFVELARYETCLRPTHDVTAHVFSQERPRPYADPPSTVVVLISDGEDPERLPRPLPKAIRCFDRFGNPSGVPRQATRSPCYIVATGEAASKLLEALRPDVSTEAGGPAAPKPDAEALLDSTVASLTQGDPPLWTRFSSQGAVAVMGTENGFAVAGRAELRSDRALAARFKLPADVAVTERSLVRTGELLSGWARLASDRAAEAAREWDAIFAAIPDGPGRSWRYVSMTIVPAGRQIDPPCARGVLDALRRMDRIVADGDVSPLRDHLYADRFFAALCKPDGDAYLLRFPEMFVTMFQTTMIWGPPSASEISHTKVAACDKVGTILGQWRIESPFFGPRPYTFTATLLYDGGGWKLASLCMGLGPGQEKHGGP